MKPTSAVLFLGGRAYLFVSGITRDSEGRLKEAWVINGAWTLRRKGDEFQAICSDNWVRNHGPDPGYVEVPYDKAWAGDYNHVMQKAQEHYDETH